VTREGVRLSSFLAAAGAETVRVTGPDPEIADLFLDSRQVTSGAIFCAIRGLRKDGARFVPEALRRGARAILSEDPRPEALDAAIAWIQVEDARRATALLAREWHGRPDEAMTLVGVTGTNGKTSVVYLMEAIAGAAARPAGRIGTVTHARGGREWRTERTTPEAPDLYRLLRAMKDDGVELAAMEVSSHALALSRVEGARFAAAVFLNFTRDHLDFHGDMERYFASKASLIERLGAGAGAVLFADDPRIAGLAGSTAARTLTFGRAESASVRIARERCTLDGTDVEIDTPAGTVQVRTRLAGRFVPENAAAATALAVAVGLPLEAVVAGAEHLHDVPGRMERVDQGQPFTVVVDYAHTEDALARLLAGIREMVDGRLLIVFGCGGDRDAGKRPAMGQVAAEIADRIFLTSDNPRSEDPKSILDDILVGVAAVSGGRERSRVIPDRAEAVREAIREARAGDVVVVAGKGHETTQTFADRVEPFDDRIVAREALAAVGFEGLQGGCRAGA
jgi:UDP-N-acetylmuramoyl-L-alanyl-D-glutamate--2,6-diaminopimelate ligase